MIWQPSNLEHNNIPLNQLTELVDRQTGARID